MSLFTVHKETLEKLWPHALPHLERFAKETLLASPEDIKRDISEGEKQLWMVEKGGRVVAVAVTLFYETLRGRVCTIWAACGDSGIEEIKTTFPEIENWAESIGCVAVEIRGRKGWKRVLEGYAETGILLEKSLIRIH